jgi:5-methylcytosine-specific restriction endonuclease McrA
MRQDPVRRERANASRRGKYKDRQRAYVAELRDQHFFRWRARNWNRNGRGPVTPQELARLWRNQRGRCALSGRPLGRDAHLDHILPKALGGISRLPNLRWLDPQVNVARQHLSDEDFALLCAQVVEVIGRQLLASIEAVA